MCALIQCSFTSLRTSNGVFDCKLFGQLLAVQMIFSFFDYQTSFQVFGCKVFRQLLAVQMTFSFFANQTSFQVFVTNIYGIKKDFGDARDKG